MIVCTQCKIPMTCIKNGIQCVYPDRDHAYAGDKYMCPGCASSVILTGHSGFHFTDYDNPKIEMIKMKG